MAAQVAPVADDARAAVAYLDRQPSWFMIVSDLSPPAGATGARHCWCSRAGRARLFLIQIGVLVLANGYEIDHGRSPLLTRCRKRA